MSAAGQWAVAAVLSDSHLEQKLHGKKQLFQMSSRAPLLLLLLQ